MRQNYHLGKKLIALMFLVLFSSFTLHAITLEQKITLKFSKVTLQEAFAQLQKEADCNVLYSNDVLDDKALVSLKADNMELSEILAHLLKNTNCSYKIENNQIIIVPSPSSSTKEVKKVTMTGRVVSDSGEPLIGVALIEKGKSNGTITDYDGNYSFITTSGNTIAISYMGFASQEVEAKEGVNNIVLREDVELLDEIVVVGYGTQKKPNLTGSVSMVSAEDMGSRPLTSVSQGLQGMLYGVTIVSASGQPGDDTSTIRIRCIGTIGNSDPLILIDGVEGDMNLLNPEDIESVSVLKDAASASIYGARAANGVVLITTKNLAKGDKMANEKTTLTFSTYTGWQMPTRLPEMVSATDFMMLQNEALQNVGDAVAWRDEQFEWVANGTNPNLFGDTSWIDEVLLPYAPQQNYSLSLNGSAGQTGYMISYRYLDQEGLLVGNSTSEQRHNIRVKLDTRLIDRVTLSTNVGYTNRNNVSPVGGLSSSGGAIYTAMRIAPNVPVTYTDGTWAYGGGNTNPVAILYDGGNTTLSYEEFSLHESAKVDIMKGWNATVTYSLVSTNSLTEQLRKTITFTNPDTPDTPVYTYQDPNSLSNSDYRQTQQTLIAQSNFDFSWDDHTVSGVGGFSQEWLVSRSFSASRENLFTEYNPTINLGTAESMSNDASASQWALRSGFGRVNYNYSDRYLAEVNLRYDLSSRFSEENRGGLFPSFSGAWRLSEESFMSSSRTIFDNIKIRGSWGMLGNQYVGSTDYPYMSVVNAVSGVPSIGTNATDAYTQTTLANPNLTWERIDMLDIGVDLTLLRNRLTFTFDWYNKNTNGILLTLNYPSQIGADPSEENVGSVNNQGWEFDVAWRETRGKFTYGVAFNLSDVKNEITDLGDTSPDLSGYQIRRVGDPIDAFYGYISEGLLTPDDFAFYDEQTGEYLSVQVPVVVGNDYQPGDIKYKDISGPLGEPDGKISPEYDRVVIGSSIPRYTYSMRGDVGYKGFDFSFSIQGVGKCDGYLEGSARHAFQDQAAYPQVTHLDRYNVETNPDPNASYPRLTYNVSFNQTTVSTFWLEDASYLRLKNVQLGYTVPASITKKVNIDKLRFYISGDNLLTLTDFYYAYDPETPVSSGGYYPQVKTVIVGLNLTLK